MSVDFPALRHLNLASAVTSLGALAGLAGVLMAAGGSRAAAATALFAAVTCDHFDGIIARRLKQTSGFGAQLDSLCDALSFCAAPALASWMLGFRGPLAAFALALFVLAGVWRLAVFNTEGLDESAGTPRFVGLPTTNAAAWWLVLSATLAVLDIAAGARDAIWTAFFVGSATLMVSSVRVPKRGWYVRVHLLLVPLSVVVVWLAD